MNIKNKVLVIEDDEAMRNAIVETLKNNNYVVESAVDGQEGMDKIDSFKPDLLLLDLNLPVMSGLSVISKVRDDYGIWGRDLKVIILTNLGASDDMLNQVAKYEPAFYLIKSEVELADVITKARECLA